jgi:dTDP-4-amino-4,6-dideoxygalactose transaminase
LPLTEEIASRLVTLPLYPSLSMAQLDTVVAAIEAYFR